MYLSEWIMGIFISLNVVIDQFLVQSSCEVDTLPEDLFRRHILYGKSSIR